MRQGPGATGLSPSPAPLSRGLGPGPPLRTLLQTTIRTSRTLDSQAGLFPVRSPLLGESWITRIQGGIQAVESNSENAAEHEKEMSISSSDSNDEYVRVNTMSFDDEVDPVKLLDKDIVFYESDNEDSGLSREQKPSSSQAGLKLKNVHPSAHAVEGSRLQSKLDKCVNTEKHKHMI
ncbi:hypothetical protein EZV62_008491 [Acer yangbiense]|uniref:Uncharacterized protein n=1 Tax=Acer yangbiense TaxID=1000413 RepID=A0A5C7IFJ7_9ROSI|nr:hypothetical protein EZV62_008491 [Acer yangbiense]